MAVNKDRDDDRRFAYCQFICCERNEWLWLSEHDPAEVKRIAAAPAGMADAAAFHWGEL